jgi:hypothetical protein
MALVILNVAYPFSRVRADAADDAERTIARLDSALVRAGHESVVMACEGSVTEGILLATQLPSNGLGDAQQHLVYDQYRFTLRRFLEKWPIDLIHMHGVDFYEYLPPPGVPVLITLHSPFHLYPENVFHLERPLTFLNCASSRQRQNCPDCANLLPELDTDVAPEPQSGDMRSVTVQYLALYERMVNDFRSAETHSFATKEASLAG